MSNWTADQITSQNGKLAIVTGANSGTGYYTALELARAGGRVILACRNQEKGGAALRLIQTIIPKAKIELGILDLSSLDSIHKFAQNFLSKNDSLDLLINNAGIMAIPERFETVDGFEMQLGTNHFGHFALTGLLLPALLRKSGARVVTVSSTAHLRGHIYFDDLQLKRGYRPWKAYSQSKLANLLFAFELQRLAEKRKWQLVSIGVHPGWTATNLQDTGVLMTGHTFSTLFLKWATRIFAMPGWQGALPSLYAGTASDITPGAYYGPDGPGGVRGYPKLTNPAPQALDQEAASKLWELSEKLTGVAFKISGAVNA